MLYSVHPSFRSQRVSLAKFAAWDGISRMSESLFDAYGARKYLVPSERAAFVRAALQEEPEFAAFCLTLAITGARISEVLALGPAGVDAANEGIVFRTLKQRGSRRFRIVPAPSFLIELLVAQRSQKLDDRLWSFRRTYAWHAVKVVMKTAGICDMQCQPKALRHGFAVDAVLNGVPLNILQRWMGHAQLETRE